ncbi:filamentous haemagglutinin family protein [Solimonas flava]|uniref:filamentous haemagglutinin family protein n=1 Tax=Solimonas flava TaxID=415849 RepID=UPI0004181EFA|nr:filamentous haemagglutinin family protein [Solimonas flava]
MGLTMLSSGAWGAQFGSPAWFAAQQNAAPAPGRASGAPPAAGSMNNLAGRVVTPDQALVRAQRSITNLSRAAEMLANGQAAQNAARQLALSGPSTVPNGLQAGGLQVAAGADSDPTLWQGAERPTQTASDGKITVTVEQTANKAILNWETFNVGRETTLHFDQSAGTQSDGSNTWVALNRVLDPSARPSQILGSIKAEGSVYVINNNGIIFGGASQVNVHSFLASSLNLFSNDRAVSDAKLLNSGIGSEHNVLVSPGGELDDASTRITTNTPEMPLSGDVVFEAGASIHAGKLGYVLVAAPDVENAGTIVADDGQVYLASALALRSGVVAAGNRLLDFDLLNEVYSNASGSNYFVTTDLTNTGLIQARRGDVSLFGSDVTQAGVVASSTSVSQPGSIHIGAFMGETSNPSSVAKMVGSIVFSADSLTAMLPDSNGATTTSSASADAAFQTGSILLKGGSVTFQGGSLLEAPGANVTVTAVVPPGYTDDPGDSFVLGRIYADDGATIDVSGLADVRLAMTANAVTVPRLGLNELADSPLQRDGVLYTQPIVIDARESGTRADGLAWIGTPLANVGGYAELVPRTVDQLLVNGGTLNLTGREVLTASGSLLNLDGGYVHYLGGTVQTTRLLGADGRIYDIASADPNMTYIGIAGQYVRSQPRWNITDTYTDPLLSGRLGHYESDYIVGGDGGTLNIRAGTAILDGSVSAAAFAGRYQVQSGLLPDGGTLAINGAGQVGTVGYGPNNEILDTYLQTQTNGNYLISDEAPHLNDIAANFDASTSLDTPEMLARDPNDPHNVRYWTTLSASQLSEAGFSKIGVSQQNGQVEVAENAHLSVQPGGTISLTGARVTIDGDLSAASGHINVVATGLTSTAPNTLPADASGLHGNGDLVVGAGAVLDASGEWVNDAYREIDERSGTATLNGGSIALTTQRALSAQNIDTSGSLVLEAGSVLDASSGGYVRPDGKLAVNGDGVAQGAGGSIRLAVYTGSSANSAVELVPGSQPVQSRLQLDGTLRAYGFSQGGTLSLRALGIQIGGDPADAAPYALWLDPQFFNGNGFASYDLGAYYDATVADGTQLHVTQQNWLPNYASILQAPSGADLTGGAYASVGTLDAYRRTSTNFSLWSGGYLNWRTEGSQSSPQPSYDGVSGTTLLGKGASIVAESGGAGSGPSVTLGGGQVTVRGSIVARGGTIALSGSGSDGSLVDPVLAVNPTTGSNRSVWLGADSLLDVSGISLIDPLASPVATADGLVVPRTGEVLDGGAVILDNNQGYVVAEEGARIDVSGSSDRYDLVQRGRTGAVLSTQDIWSDAGSITIGARDGLYLDATIGAHGGSEQARGGTLSIIPEKGGSTPQPGSPVIVLQQSGRLLPDGLQPGDDVEPDQEQASGALHLAVDRLAGSGIENLHLGGDSTGVGTLNWQLLTPVAFSGDVHLALDRSLTINASSLVALPEGSSDVGAAPAVDTQVVLDAPYVEIYGANNRTALSGTLPAPAGATLEVSGDFVDIGGRLTLRNFTDAEFRSSGDIRFRTDADDAYSGTTALSGQLLTAGDLTFSAAQIYPATDNAFAIVASGAVDPLTGQRADTTITIEGKGADAQTPLSANGRLLLDATHIEQGGTLRAPAGSIVLGVDDADDAGLRAAFGNAPYVATQSVHLADGSLTSVSLDGQTVPWGVTVDQVDWQDHGSPGQTSYPNLGAPPEKQITIAGTDVALDAGATVDLEGGGDLYATEWIPGAGGSRDVLSRTNTVYSGTTPTAVPLYADGRAVYALVPGSQASVAPYDPSLDSGDVRVGQAVYLSGAAGIPAGVYTLMPARYATLPGAYRVVQDTGALDVTGSTRLADGTLRVSGYYADTLTGARDARSTAFLVQSREVWGQYSEYAVTSANAYFAKLAQDKGTAVPRLPVDAGRLTLAASDSLSLGASLQTAAGEGGAGAQVDIASARIQISGGGAGARDGYLQLDVADLNALGAESLLIGGARSQDSSGVTIDAQASSVVVSNDQNSALGAPEILLVTNGGSGAEGDGLHIESGSVIRAEGKVPETSSVPIRIGRDEDSSGNAGISGDGALLRLSNGAPVLVDRRNISGDGGLLQIGAGATLDGGAALSLDATGDTRLDATALLQAKAIDANGSLVSIVATAADAEGRSGLVIGPETLAQFGNAESITLRSRGAMDFVGALDLALDETDLGLSAARFVGDGHDVHLAARTLTLGNELNGSAAAPAMTSAAALHLDAGVLNVGAGDAQFAGFASVDARATQMISGRGTGSLDFGDAAVTLAAPALVAGGGADSTVRTAGALHLASAEGTLPDDLPVGGALTLVGDSVDGNARLVAPAGNVTLHATQGDVALAAGAVVDVSGVAKDFFDVKRYADGGAISLVADHGNVTVAQGATLDFAADEGGGDAGSLSVHAAEGSVQLDGELRGNAAEGQTGGAFTLESGSAVALDAIADRLLSGGIDRAIRVQSHNGDLQLSAGHTLQAQEVTLVADAGEGGNDAAQGRVIVGGTIDASGEKGGDIALYGKSGVDVQGTLRASASGSEERGGTVKLYTTGITDGSYDAEYGYQNVRHEGSGTITIGSAALIDVSGGSEGGSVQIRAPLLDDGDVNVFVQNGAQIKGAREVGLEAYAVWSTTDATAGAQHFDGVIDPAGWYDAGGQLLPGTFTDADGKALGTSGDLSKDFYTPDQANADHVGFYQDTLADFVQQPGFTFEDRFAQIDHFVARPGIELRNPSPNVNGGKIAVLTNWNLGATDVSGNYVYRYGGAAPVLTVRAAGDLQVKASITDGFRQYFNSAGSPPTSTLGEAQAALDQYLADGLPASYIVSPATFDSGDPASIGYYYTLYEQYASFLRNPAYEDIQAPFYYDAFPAGTTGEVPGAPTEAPVAPTDPREYASYLTAYADYFAQIVSAWSASGYGVFPNYEQVAAPPTILVPLRGPVDNTPSPIVTASNPLPLLTSNLAGTDSSSYRFAAGANFASSDPLALHGTGGDLTLDGHTTFNRTDDNYGVTTVYLSPTLIRTGTGSIELAAAHDIALLDEQAPGAIYAAGRQSAATAVGTESALVITGDALLAPGIVVSGVNTPEDGGKVSLHAQNDILGLQQVYDVDGSITGQAGNLIAQYWTPWMQTANTATQSSINFGAFDQGVMSVGGDVEISAGRDISQLQVSLPTTWYLGEGVHGEPVVNTVGGGDLAVSAGRDILSGSYFVAKGEGNINAGRSIAAGFAMPTDNDSSNGAISPAVATLFALQDARLEVNARQSIDIGGVYNPSYVASSLALSLGTLLDSQAYSADSAIKVSSLGGDVSFDTLKLANTLFSYGLKGNRIEGFANNNGFAAGYLLPATLDLMAFDGNISMQGAGALYPSQTGNLALVADGSVTLYNDAIGAPSSAQGLGLGLIDVTGALPSPLERMAAGGLSNTQLGLLTSSNSNAGYGQHESAPLHGTSREPVRIYALNGDIIDGTSQLLGLPYAQLVITPNKPAQLQAGRDIVNLAFVGQNFSDSDVTRIVAGRDLYTTPIASAIDVAQNETYVVTPSLELGGPGLFDIEAGRNLGPLTPANLPSAPGIRTVGNLYNPYLPREGASVMALYGVAPGVDVASFAARYIDPSAPQVDGVPDYGEALIAFMEQYGAGQSDGNDAAAAGGLTVDEAWVAFEQLPAWRQQIFVQQVFFDILDRTGRDYNDPESLYHGQYARGYAAINTLFPAAWGYTANELGGGINGATAPVQTGNLDLRRSTIQTQQGGNVSLLGPGGDALVGSSSAPPVITDSGGKVLAGPNALGILTLETGNVDIFTDRSLLLAQSRIFTEQGGDILIWSSNGDVNAGKGAKTTSEIPPPSYLCDPDHYCYVDAKSQVSGAGIATLATKPDTPPGDAVLVAPRGTVDAGDAGIRSSGNLVVAAFAVANADNIQVQGETVGVPTGLVNVGALNTANSAAAAAQASADALANQRPPERAASMITVEVVGFGQPDAEQKRKLREQ